MKYSFKQLLKRVNESLDTNDQWRPSKLRYYLLEVLEEAPQTRGKESTYPELTSNKLLFITKLMENKLNLSVKQIKKILADVSEEELARLADGSEPLEIGVPSFDQSGMPIYETLSGKTYAEDDPALGRVIQTSLSKKSTKHIVKDSASDYLDGVFRDKIMKSSVPQAPASWQTIHLGPDLEIRHKMSLTQDQKRQLKLTGELLRLMLGKEK